MQIEYSDICLTLDSYFTISNRLNGIVVVYPNECVVILDKEDNEAILYINSKSNEIITTLQRYHQYREYLLETIKNYEDDCKLQKYKENVTVTLIIMENLIGYV